MDRWLRFSGILGVVLFSFGFIGALLVRRWPPETILVVHVGLGLGLVFFWFLTSGVKNLQNAGGVIKGRTTRFTANALLYTAVFLGLVGSLNWFVKKYDKRWDLTADNVFSLADQSAQTVKNLNAPLKIVGLKTLQGGEKLKDLMELYRNANTSKVSVEYVDPQTKPHLVDRYQMKPGNLVYLQYGEGEKSAVSRLNEITEEAITNAIIKLTRGAAKKIYYVQGHGEPNLKGVAKEDLKELVDAIEDEHLTIEGFLLAQKGEIPADAAAVMLVSPKKPMLPEEKDVLVKYAEAGGRLVLLSDPRTTPDVKDIASNFGISINDDIIVDQVQRLMAAPALGVQPIAYQYENHPITKSFTQENITIFNMASTVAPIGDAAVNTVKPLVKSSPQAWGETNMDALFNSDRPTAAKEPSDVSGPVAIGVVYEKKLDTPKIDPNAKPEEADGFKKVSRVVVFGDSDWIQNGFITAFSNRDLILNTINWVVGEDGGITIRPKSIRQSMAPMSVNTFLSLLAAGFIIPELILLFGLYVWWNRRTTSIA